MQFIRGEPDWRLSARQHHEAFENETALLDELPLIGQMHLLDALPNSLVPHSHANIYEIHFVIDGCLAFSARGNDYDVRGGMVFLTKPGEIHGAVDSALQPASWYWIHLKFPADDALPGLSLAETRALEASFARTSLNLFSGSDELRDCFTRLLNEHRNPSAHGNTIARAQFHELMVRIVRDHDLAAAKSASAGVSKQVRLALNWIDENLGEPLSIPELAEASGLSESHFRQCFHKETGFTPSDYLARQRVVRAKALLKDRQLPITEIAYRLGFGSSPYFSAVFKKLTGMTPSEYRGDAL